MQSTKPAILSRLGFAKLKASAIQATQHEFDASMPSANQLISTEGLAFSGTASVGAAL